LKFNKFITKIRNKFSQIFDHALKTQLVLKGICTSEEWDEFRDKIYYDYRKDNNFTELRDAELWQNRLQMLGLVDPYVGRYFSQEWVKKNILQLTDDDIKAMDKQIGSEPEPVQMGPDGRPLPPDQGQEQDQEQVDPADFPPEDNISDRGSNESDTPEHDAVVSRFSRVLNRK
jgi:hypothetical protein